MYWIKQNKTKNSKITWRSRKKKKRKITTAGVYIWYAQKRRRPIYGWGSTLDSKGKSWKMVRDKWCKVCYSSSQWWTNGNGRISRQPSATFEKKPKSPTLNEYKRPEPSEDIRSWILDELYASIYPQHVENVSAVACCVVRVRANHQRVRRRPIRTISDHTTRFRWLLGRCVRIRPSSAAIQLPVLPAAKWFRSIRYSILKKFKNPAQFLNLISFLTDRVMSYQGRNSLSRPKFSSLKPLKNYFTNESELYNQLINYPDG